MMFSKLKIKESWHIFVVQLLSCVQLFATSSTAGHQASLSSAIFQSLLKLMCSESVMPSSHVILCHPVVFTSGKTEGKSFCPRHVYKDLRSGGWTESSCEYTRKIGLKWAEGEIMLQAETSALHCKALIRSFQHVPSDVVC